jgi:heat-inducible transcriptional repressor
VTLDSRKGRILQAIVNDYVETAEPIGSEWLASHYDFGCKSATLRNEMAEMSERGYLVQPHTSAGRIPSTRGYRYYVDCLMTPDAASVDQPETLTDLSTSRVEVSEMVQWTCRALSEMTRYPSVATTPAASGLTLHRLYLTSASARHVLLVVLFSTGHVEHRLLEVGQVSNAGVLEHVTNYLNETLGGRTLEDLSSRPLGPVPGEMVLERSLLETAHDAVRSVAQALAENDLYVEGTTHILRQREFQDVLRLEQVLDALQQRSVLFQFFSRALRGEEVTVIIGNEGPVQMLYECSVVTSAYRIGNRKGGYIGVVGPTRMNYDRAVSAVGLMARSLSMLLSRTCLE